MRAVFTVLAFAGKEIRQVLRQPKLIAALIVGPFLILGLFAVGFQPAPPPLDTVLVIPEGSPLAAETENLTEDLGAAVNVVDVATDADAARSRLERGEISLVLVAPRDPLASVEGGEQATVTVLHSRVDPFDRAAIAVSAQTAVDHLNRAILAEAVAAAQREAADAIEAVDAAQEMASALSDAIETGDGATASATRDDLSQALAGVETGLTGSSYPGALTGDGSDAVDTVGEMRSPVDRVDVDDPASAQEISDLEGRLAELSDEMTTLADVPSDVLVEPFVVDVQTVSGIDVPLTTYYTPAVLVVLLQHVIVTFAALSIVSERALRTTELFRVGPVRISELMAGKALGYGVIGTVVAALLAIGVIYLLGTPMAGGWGWLALVLGLVIAASLGLGFVIAWTAESDAQAVQYSMLALLFTIFFSGMVVSLDRLAEGVRYVAFLAPATAGTSALQQVMFLGRSPSPYLIAILATYAASAIVLARWGLGRQKVA